MALKDKYKELIGVAQSSGVSGLQVREQENVLYIDGEAPSYEIQNKLWEVYDRIDPDYRSSDLVMNVTVSPTAQHEEYVVSKGDNLSKIGKKYGLTWKEIYNANKDLIKNPDLIYPGWKLKIPRKGVKSE